MQYEGDDEEMSKAPSRMVSPSEAFAYRLMDELSPETRVRPDMVLQQAERALQAASRSNKAPRKPRSRR